VDDHVAIGFEVDSLGLYHEYTSIWDGKLSLEARVRGVMLVWCGILGSDGKGGVGWCWLLMGGRS